MCGNLLVDSARISLMSMKYGTVCPLDLSISSRVCHRDVFYHYSPFILEVPKSIPGELSTQISDDAVGYVEAVDDLVEERDRLF